MLIFILCIESGSNFEFNINKDEQNVNNIINVVSFKNSENIILDDEIVICMGAGSISNWIREIGTELQ